MQRSFKARLAALEALEAEQAAPPDPVWCVFLQIRPADYAALCGDDDDAAARVFCAYGLHQIPEGARVNIWGGTWAYALAQNELTIFRQQDVEGWGYRIDHWPQYDGMPVPDEWHWCVARAG
jgi:hypothetical protein